MFTEEDFAEIKRVAVYDLQPAAKYADAMVSAWGETKNVKINMQAILQLAYDAAYQVGRDMFREESEEDFDEQWALALDWIDYEKIKERVNA